MINILTRSLAAKILAVFVPLVFFTQLIVFGFQTWLLHSEHEANLIQRLNVLAESQATALAPAVWEFDSDEIDNLVAQLEKLPFIQSILIIDSDDEVLVSRGDVEAVPEDPSYQVVYPIIYEPQSNSQYVGEVTLTGHSGEIWSDLMRRTQFNGLLLLVMMVALAAGVLATTRYFIGKPLNQMKNSINQARAGEERTPVEWGSRDELGIVVQAYNEMLVLEKKSATEIRAQQENLERLVDERTSEFCCPRCRRVIGARQIGISCGYEP